MEYTFGERLKHAWNAFQSRSPTYQYKDLGVSSSYRPDRVRLTRGNERSIVTAIYNRIALDVAATSIRHVNLDPETGRYLEDRRTGLNNCLTLEANKDQTARSFIQDIVISMFDEGCVAVIPIDTDDDPERVNSYDIFSMRVGRILDWYPDHIRVEAYNDRTGKREQKLAPKKMVAIVENPLYAVMNEPNSTLQRLLRKLVLLDTVDDRNSSGKLDMIIQLPYSTHAQIKKEQAEERRKQVEEQLTNSKYGVAYIDSMEKIIQLNRPLENNLMTQVEYLTSMLYSQLGLTQEIMNGSADDRAMVNYRNRTIEPILSAITDEMTRKFLTKTARTQGQAVTFFHDPFKLITVEQLADLSDKLIRGEIATPNEMRQVAGMKPSNDPKSDELRNRNLNESKKELADKAGSEMSPLELLQKKEE